MKLFDYITLAFKNLTRRKARTFLTIIAITVGSISLILMTSIIIGIRQSLQDQFMNLGAFDLVTVVKDPNSTDSNSLLSSNGDPNSGKMIDNATLLAMKKIPDVIGATPILSNVGVNTMRVEGSEKKVYANVAGYDPDSNVFNLPISYGRKLVASDLDSMIVGSRFIQDMGYAGHPQDLLGKHVILNYQSGGSPDWGDLPTKPLVDATGRQLDMQNKAGIDIPAEIVGVSDSGVLDDGQSYISLAWARRLMTQVRWEQNGDGGPGCNGPNCGPQAPRQQTWKLMKEDRFLEQGYSTIVLKADDKANVETIADAVKALKYGANTAKAMLDQIDKIFAMIRIVLAVIGGISLFVATIGIVNTMVMATFERTREIGVLRACGATRATIRRLFMAEAASLGFWGGMFGLIISIILAHVAKFAVEKYGASLGPLPLDHLGDFPWWLIVSVIVFSTLLGMISGLIPAIKAARLNPVEALRYE